MKNIAVPPTVLEESLHCLLTRVRWYVVRGHGDRDIPESTRLAFNYLCDALGKPNVAPWNRIRS
jgi:hypothetical protein